MRDKNHLLYNNELYCLFVCLRWCCYNLYGIIARYRFSTISMISKLTNIFFKPGIDIISTKSDPVCYTGLDEVDATSRGYFVDRTTGLGFIFSQDAFIYSKKHRRLQFFSLLLVAVFYPLIGLFSLYQRDDCKRVDVLRTIIFYVPLCIGIISISCFGLFCPLRAVTLVHSLESSFLGKAYLRCMSPVKFKKEHGFFSRKRARLAELRQHIIIRLLVIIALCAVRFSPIFVWLKQQLLLYFALGLMAQNIAIVVAYLVFGAAIFAVAWSLVVAVQSSHLSEYEVAKCDGMLENHIAFHLSLLVIVCCCLVLISYGGVVILSPALLANVISIMSVGATLLLHYWGFKSDAKALVKLLLAGEYTFADAVNFDVHADFIDEDDVPKRAFLRMSSGVKEQDVFTLITDMQKAEQSFSDVAENDVLSAVISVDVNVTPEYLLTVMAGLAEIEAGKIDHGKTALMAAAGCKGNSVAIAKILLHKGVNINARDYDGRTALMQAYASGNEKLAKFLLEQGAYINNDDLSSQQDDYLAKACLKKAERFSSLEKEGVSWWQRLYFRIAGKGKFKDLIVSYEHEIKSRYNAVMSMGIFEDITITARMANLIAKIRSENNEGRKNALKRKLKHAYVKANGATASQQGYSYHYSRLFELYADYAKLLDSKNDMVSYEKVKHHTKCTYEDNAARFNTEIGLIKDKISSLHGILGINDVELYEDQAFGNLSAGLGHLGERHNVSTINNKFDNLYRGRVLHSAQIYINNHNASVSGRVQGIKDSGHYKENLASFDIAKLEHKLLNSFWFYNKYCQDLSKLYAERYNLPEKVFTNKVIFKLAKSNEQQRMDNNMYDHVVDALVLEQPEITLKRDDLNNKTILESAREGYKKRIDKDMLLRRARGLAFDIDFTSIFYWLSVTNIDEHQGLLKLVNDSSSFKDNFNVVELEVLKEVIIKDISVYTVAIQKAQARFEQGEQLLTNARGGARFLDRCVARLRYYLGGYFIRVNLLYVLYGFLRLVRDDIGKNTRAFYGFYRNRFSISFGADPEGGGFSIKAFVWSFIRECIIGILQFFVDLIFLPIFACYSFLLGAYYTYRSWLHALDRPEFSYRLLSWLFGIVVMVLQLLIDIICLPIFSVSYPVWCVIDYLHTAHHELCGEYKRLLKYHPNVSEVNDEGSLYSSGHSKCSVSAVRGAPATSNNIISKSSVGLSQNGDRANFLPPATTGAGIIPPSEKSRDFQPILLSQVGDGGNPFQPLDKGDEGGMVSQGCYDQEEWGPQHSDDESFDLV